MQGKRTKVLYVITKSNWGGAQKYVYDLATSLEKEQFEAVVALGGNGILADKLRKAGIRVINISSLDRDINILKEFTVLIDLLKIFKKEKPNIIHLNSSKIGGLGALAGRIYSILNPKRSTLSPKIIFTAHGFAHNEDRPKIFKLLLFILSYITIILTHKTIIINKKEYDQMIKMPFIYKKLELIYIGIKETSFLRIDKSPDNPVIIGTISELTKNKGLSYIIEAAARLKNKNITLSIIGEGEERKNLGQLIEKLAVNDKVQLLGFRENATSYLSMFDIFTLTSLKEGMPYAILEAGLAGLPVIASDVGGISEMIEDGKSGILIEPKNVEQIVFALTTLINDPEKRKQLGESLRQTVISKFSLKKMTEETEELYRA